MKEIGRKNGQSVLNGYYREVSERVQEMGAVKGYAGHKSQEVGTTPQQAQGNSWAGQKVKREG